MQKRNMIQYAVESMTTLKHKAIKWNIELKHILLIEGFAAEKKTNLFIPQTVIDLILFFYAKPLNIKLIWDDKINIITYCPINNEWKYLMTKIRRMYGLHPCHPITLQSKNENIILDENNWNNGQWNDNEEFIFSLDISIHEMKEYMNESVVKVQNALITTFNKNVSTEFIQFIIEEGFDEETLKEEIEDDWMSPLECCFVEYLVDVFPDLFNTKDQQKQLLQLMNNAINDKFDQQQINEIKWIVTKEQLKKTNEFWTNRYAETVHEYNKSLIEVLCIGETNDIPLLNWLTDTFNRYRINEYILSNKTSIYSSDWFEEYWLYKELRDKHKQRVRDKLHSATQSFLKGRGAGFIRSIPLHSPYFLIDDDINKFAVYFIAMSEAIDDLVEIHDGYMVPFQIDMLIIPKQVSQIKQIKDFDNDSDSDDEYEVDDDDDDVDEFGVKIIGNIGQRLKAANFRYTKHVIDDGQPLKRILLKQIKLQIDDRRNQRIIIYVDRRDPKYNNMKKCNNQKKWNDTIYFVQSPDRSYYEISKYEYNTALTSFYASCKCMLPPKVQQHNDSYSRMYGCCDSLDGFQFTLSWHINSKHLIRCYWFARRGGTRFFPSDAMSLWPIYFKNHRKINKKTADKLKQMKQVKDDQFVNWYENTTKSKLLFTLND